MLTNEVEGLFVTSLGVEVSTLPSKILAIVASTSLVIPEKIYRWLDKTQFLRHKFEIISQVSVQYTCKLKVIKKNK